MQILTTLKKYAFEILLFWAFLFTLNNYLHYADKTIKSDGIGYYDYLPSIFKYGDLVRKDYYGDDSVIFYNRVHPYGVYRDYKSHLVNKYPCGTAILVSPFFIVTYFYEQMHQSNGIDEYGPAFQRMFFYAAIFYLFLAVVFINMLLQLYRIKRANILFIQILLLFATSVMYYTNDENALSHVYSLFAITAFLYFVKSYFSKYQIRDFIWACALLGLIILLRQVNILVVLLIPFLAGSIENLKAGILQLFKKPFKLILGIAILISIVFVQCLLWYLQTGDFIVDSYQNESFNFLKPAFVDILFSYKKGLFVYTPVLFIAMFGLFRLMYQKKYYLVFTWSLFFVILTYVLSSWWSWFYGCSYGLRAYIDFYAVFFILLALLLNDLDWRIKTPVMLLCILTIPLNLIQSYQYKVFILHWIDMDKEKYWRVFLKQDVKYERVIWKTDYDYHSMDILASYEFGDKKIISNNDSIIFQITVPNGKEFKNANNVQITFENEFSEESESKFLFLITDSIAKGIFLP